MKRRSFLTKLFGGAVLTVTKLQALAPVENVKEIQESKQYLVTLNYAHPEKCKEFENWLRFNGINAIVVSGPLELFEIEKKATY